MADYYVILGIPANATARDIKNAYRRLAKEFHPDSQNGNNTRFRSIHEAYTVLGDPEQRKKYDKSLRADMLKNRPECKTGIFEEPAEPLTPEHGSRPYGPPRSRLFRSFSSHAAAEEMRARHPRFHRHRSSQSGPGVEVMLTAQQAACGGRVRIQVPFRTRCRYCLGYGGRGRLFCRYCRGEGFVIREIPVDVGFPAGVGDGHLVRVSLAQYGIPGALAVHFRLRERF